jgi:hypothetical protein
LRVSAWLWLALLLILPLLILPLLLPLLHLLPFPVLTEHDY